MLHRYKPPLKKRIAELQWRILHRAIASNAFINTINPAVKPVPVLLPLKSF